jgi:phosphate-selective porin OprO/OprP
MPSCTLYRTLPLVASLTFGITHAAHAGIAELLLKKGVITQDEYQQLKAEAAAQPAPALASTPVAPIPPPTPAISFSKGFVVTGIDGTFQAQVGTLMQLDAATYNDPSGFDNNAGTSIRRGRIYVQGTVMKDWQYRFESEFFGSTGTEITDAYVRYNGFLPFESGKPLAVTAGHFKIPFGFEQLMSDKDLPFMERALQTAFVKTRAPGAMLSTSGANWSAAGMVFGEQLYSNTTTPQQDEGGGASARLT